MDHPELLLYPAMLLILTFYGAKRAGRKETAAEYLSLSQTRLIQTSACLGVVLHHLAQAVTGYGDISKGPITVLSYMGIHFTALFFFFSGYGLLTRLSERQDYLEGFLVRRLLAVLVPFWMINAILLFSDRFFFGIRRSLPEVFCDLTGITLINSNGWFIIEISLLYLAFYVLFRLIRNRDAALILLCLFTCFLIALGFCRGHDTGEKAHWFRGEWWYNSTAAFMAGCLYARGRKKLDAFVRDRYPFLLGLFSVLTVLSVRASIYAVRRFGYYRTEMLFAGRRYAAVTLAVQSVSCLFFVALVLLLNRKITLGNRALKALSPLRIPLFLTHGYLVSRVLDGLKMKEFPWFALALFVSLSAAALIALPIGRAADLAGRLSLSRPGRDLTLEGMAAEKRKARRLVLFRRLLAVLILFLAAAFAFSLIRTRTDFKQEKAALRTAGTGDEIFFGRFETDRGRPGRERLTWIVIRREEDRVCLLSRFGIAGSPYHRRHTAVDWENSDLRALLQSEAFTGMFSSPERDLVLPVEGDIISLLTAREAAEFFASDTDRELAITRAAEADGTNINTPSKTNYWDMKGYRSSWWWLKGEKGVKSDTAPIVTVDGALSMDKQEVSRAGGAVRPVIWVRIPEAP